MNNINKQEPKTHVTETKDKPLTGSEIAEKAAVSASPAQPISGPVAVAAEAKKAV